MKKTIIINILILLFLQACKTKSDSNSDIPLPLPEVTVINPKIGSIQEFIELNGQVVYYLKHWLKPCNLLQVL